MPLDFAKKVIDESSYGTLALYDQERDRTYGVSLSIVRIGNRLYFHSAKAGYKLSLLKEGRQYGLSFVSYAKVPQAFSQDQLRALAQDPKKVALFLSRVFTTEFYSAHVFGKLYQVTDPLEIKEAMEALCKKYTGDKMEFFPLALEAGLPRMNVYGIEIQEIYGKRKKLDSQGQELKWQREEN